MNLQGHRVCLSALLLLLLVIFFAPLTVPARSSSVRGRRARSSGAAGVVQSFFRYHFAHDKGFTGANIRQRRRWLTPELYRLLLDEYHREEVESAKHPEEAVFMEGDPFTNTQEHPDSFRVGQAVVRGAQATVPVTFLWTGGNAARTANIELKRRGRVWLIHNVLSADDEDLLKLLRGRLQNSVAQ